MYDPLPESPTSCHIPAWKSVTGTVTYYRKHGYSSASSHASAPISFGTDCAFCLFCLSGPGDQLLQYKADINAVNEHGNVPLHYACFWGQDQVAEVSTQALSPGMGGKQSLNLSGRLWNPQLIL